jgi:hypothetical protein
MLIFAEGGKPEKNPRSKGENQQQTQLTIDLLLSLGHFSYSQA